MSSADLIYIKSVLRSVLTSFPGNITVSQMLQDYADLEGEPLPYQKLGFKNVFKLLETLSDVLKIPPNASFHSQVKLIVDNKTVHLRELVVNQKNKKARFRKRISHSINQFNSHNSRHSSYKPTTKPNVKSYNARGYNYVKTLSHNSSKPKGFVTKELQKYIENLCIKNMNISIASLKYYLINHQDYSKLSTTNIDEAINMLKYFIYIDKGGVHLKNSPYEIFPSSHVKPNYQGCLQNYVDEIDEMSYSDNYTNNDLINDILDHENLVNELNNVTNTHSKDKNSISPKKIENISKSLTSTTTEPILNLNIKPKPVFKINQIKELINNDPLKNEGIDYKHAMVSIISKSYEPITVNQALNKFHNIYGHDFPFYKFSCRTSMDFFRLYPALFKLDNQYSSNSFVRIKEEIEPTRTSTIRTSLINASINNFPMDNSKNNSLIKDFKCKSRMNNYHKQYTEHLNNTNCITSIDSKKMQDSDMVMESMKEKLRRILIKYKNGIKCNEFMDIYLNEYHTYFTYSEYGFKSMKDMAYNLPSVFFVKEIEGNSECILYESHKQDEIRSLDDPSHFKNIPKTILHNLSIFFDKYRTRLSFEDLKTLYCAQFGRSYEPLKYGYSSEKHMFKSLDKMVEIYDNTLITIDPFAYTSDLIENGDFKEKNDNRPVFPLVSNNLLNYTSRDVCSGQFVYPPFEYHHLNENLIKIVIAEVYGPNSFYIQLASKIDALKNFMDNLQKFYDMNEHLYEIAPELITPGMICVSRFEDSYQWHRAKVLKTIDNHSVQVLYVDYGSIDTISKSNIRLLKTVYGSMSIQALHCCLNECNDKLYVCSREMNEKFAQIVDDKILLAKFQPSQLKVPSEIMLVTLFDDTDRGRIHINSEWNHNSKVFETTYNINLNSIRTQMTNLLKCGCDHFSEKK